ncbi:phosphotransferase family protein [Micromonospora globbae]|uniref:Aminoglycoside phosphotransferase family protein n=1 Tax=Micromonospora globbae TaxID=1894969 RepID=A0A420EY80_9ACTN|nr:aminoglycoside phosphotransferase family protein [Micromonospora globbae]RKF25650.1 aminoglycoside phosphotransferase family protein [Micromonospora globbae]
MTAAMREAADAVGVHPGDARLLGLTNNAVFALPSAGMVIRIARSHRLTNRVYKVVELGRWFEQVDAPTIRLAPNVTQPVRAGTLLASIWSYIPPVAPTPTVEDLGPVLREFHSLGPLPERLPAWDPVGDARSRLADAEELSDSDRQFLLDWCDRLEAPVAALQQRAGSGIIHGDAHVSNLLRNAAGRVVLCDFDATCLGPWQVDLVAVAVGEVRFGQRGAHATLAAAYGYDVTTDPDWPLLRDARELKMIAAAVPRLRSSAGVRAEFAARLHSVRENHQHARWKPFAEIGG